MKKKILFLSIIYFLFHILYLGACTGITIKSKDGSWVYGRTLEFAKDLYSNLIIVPRGYTYSGTTPEGNNGLQWNVTYAFAGLNGAIIPTLVADGINEKGLAAGAFYLPGYAVYQQYKKELSKKTVSPMDVPAWILSNFATVKEVKENLKTIRVVPVTIKEWGFVPPLHFIVTDSTGESIVIEYIKGEVVVHQNPIGVITNAPTFDWHLTNLANYINLSPDNASPKKIGRMTIKQLGQGSGMLGLPGDFTPPSRFIRATALSQSTAPGETAYKTVQQLFHILNQFDIPQGTVCNDKGICEKTQWTSAADLANKRYYFHTVNNRSIRMVDLNKADLDAKSIVSIPVASVDEKVEDLTPKAGKLK